MTISAAKEVGVWINIFTGNPFGLFVIIRNLVLKFRRQPKEMFNVVFFVIVLSLGLLSVSSMSIKRSARPENNLEKVDETEYPIKVNYDVYPVRTGTVGSFFVQQVRRFSPTSVLRWNFLAFGFEFHVGGDICVTDA